MNAEHREWTPDPDRPGYERSLISNGVMRRRIPGGSTMGTQAAPNVKGDVEIGRMFAVYVPSDAQKQLLNSTSIEFTNLGRFLDANIPPSRQRSLMTTHLEEAWKSARSAIEQGKVSDTGVADYAGKNVGAGIADRAGGTADARSMTG